MQQFADSDSEEAKRDVQSKQEGNPLDSRDGDGPGEVQQFDLAGSFGGSDLHNVASRDAPSLGGNLNGDSES